MSFFTKIKSFVNRTVSFFTKLFGEDAGNFYAEFITKIAPLVNKAYPIVVRIAQLTPTRTDDMILAAYQALGFKDYFESVGDDVEKQKQALRNLAKLAIQDMFKDQKIQDWVLNAVVELAYSQYKTKMIAVENNTDPVKVVEEIVPPVNMIE